MFDPWFPTHRSPLISAVWTEPCAPSKAPTKLPTCNTSAPSSAVSSTSASSRTTAQTSTTTSTTTTPRADPSLTTLRRARRFSLTRDPSDTNNMLTLDEFLRETTAANANATDAESRLEQLLLLRRSNLSRSSEAGLWRRSLLETPRRRGLPEDPTPAEASALTADENPALDSWTRIRQLQDALDDGEQPGDRERSAIARWRVRETAVQNRIDLLASEFALLRNTQRELRRVREPASTQTHPPHSQSAGAVDRFVQFEAELLGALQNTRSPPPLSTATTAGSNVGEPATVMAPTPPIITSARRVVRRTLLNQPGVGRLPAVTQVEETPTQRPVVSLPPAAAAREESPVITESERDLALRNAVMEMQLARAP